jgi:tripartite-type tricarboxylate transporter receptor subunit TctC
MLTKEFVVGGTGVGSNLEIYPRVINSILGAKIKIISGYKGGNNVALAMERGEVHGRCGWPPSSIKTSRPQWLKEGKLKLLLQTGIEKDPDLPDVPLIMDFVKNGDDRAVMELVFAARSLLRPVLAPPGIPEDRKAALRAAFMKTMGDPAYQAEARKLKLLVKPKTGEAVEALVLKLHRTPKPIVERTIKAMKK